MSERTAEEVERDYSTDPVIELETITKQELEELKGQIATITLVNTRLEKELLRAKSSKKYMYQNMLLPAQAEVARVTGQLSDYAHALHVANVLLKPDRLEVIPGGTTRQLQEVQDGPMGHTLRDSESTTEGGTTLTGSGGEVREGEIWSAIPDGDFGCLGGGRTDQGVRPAQGMADGAPYVEEAPIPPAG